MTKGMYSLQKIGINIHIISSEREMKRKNIFLRYSTYLFKASESNREDL